MATEALIVVDMLNDFIRPDGALFCGETATAIVPEIRRLIDDFHENGHPVIHLRDNHRPDDLEFEKFPPHCVAGTPGADIVSELAAEDGDIVIAKTRFSGFYNTDLAAVLAANGIDRATVVGVCTSICVMDTVGGLANRDIAVRVPKDAVADFDPAFHDFALSRMAQLYGAEIQ